jgi:hypothetical protein
MDILKFIQDGGICYFPALDCNRQNISGKTRDVRYCEIIKHQGVRK